MRAKGRWLLAGACLGLAATAALVPNPTAQNRRRQREEDAPRAPEPLWLSPAGQIAFEPSLAADSKGGMWCVWVAWNAPQDSAPGEADATSPGTGSLAGVWRAEDGELLRFEIPAGAPFPAQPHLICGADKAWVVWEAGREGERQLFSTSLMATDALPGKAQTASKVAIGAIESIPGSNLGPLAPKLVLRASGAPSVVFQSERGGQYDIAIAERTASGWQSARPLFESEHDEWDPQPVLRNDGSLAVIYDRWPAANETKQETLADPSFDVELALLDEAGTLTRYTVAGGPQHQAHPSATIDARDRIWITWEESERFGRGGPLRSERALGLAVFDAGKVHAVETEAWSPRRGRNDLPRIHAAPNGLFLSSRRTSREKPKVRGKSFWYTTWQTEIFHFDKQGDGQRDTLATSHGHNGASESFASSGAATYVAYATDQRLSGFGAIREWGESIEGPWRIALERLPQSSGYPSFDASRTEPSRAFEPAGGKPSGKSNAPVPSGATDSSSSERRIYWGDLHRHTHLSRCSGSKDGTIADAYRYARGPGRLDFIAVTDHYQHMQPWSWWISLRDTLRHYAPHRLVTFPAVERVRPMGGHYNDLYLDPHTIPFAPEIWRRPSGTHAPQLPVVSIPHMLGIGARTGFNWDDFQPDRHRVLELFQGYRGSYEGAGLPYEAVDRERDEVSLASGLERGLHFGLIASSDHASSNTSLAGLWAVEATRESIFEALRARRSLAATARTKVDARLGALKMGERGLAAASAPFELFVSGENDAARIATIDVLKNGEPWQSLPTTDEAPDALVELYVISLRTGLTPRHDELVISARGGQIQSARLRRTDSGGDVQLKDGRATLTRDDFTLLDLAIEVAWPGEEPGRIGFERGDKNTHINAGEWPLGRAKEIQLPGDRSGNASAQLWRLGRTLDKAGGTFPFPDPARRPGDVYYARIAWTDGELAWTSPIRVDGEPQPLPK